MAPRIPKDASKTIAKDKATPRVTGKPIRNAAKAKASAVESVAETVATLRLKDIVDTVTAATGAKKPEVKKTVEATLAAIGAALGTGSMLVLPPLGKLRVVKATATALTLKLRPAGSGKADALALADPEQDS